MAQEQEFAEGQVQGDGVLGYFGEGQDFDAVDLAGFVGGGVAAAGAGIDRYLDGAAGSSGVLEQVDDGAAAVAADVVGGLLGDFDLHDGGLIGRLGLGVDGVIVYCFGLGSQGFRGIV